MDIVSGAVSPEKEKKRRALLVIDHPWNKSFNFVIAERIKNELEGSGVFVDFLNLHEECFNPVLGRTELAEYTKGVFKDPKVGEYQERIKSADFLVFVFPIWWAVMPALLKGFIDKIFLPGWAFKEEDASPLLNHVKNAVVVTTMGAPQEGICTVEDSFCRGLLEFCGIQNWKWFNITEVSNISNERRTAFLDEVGGFCRNLAE